jgi:hypothetical protein
MRKGEGKKWRSRFRSLARQRPNISENVSSPFAFILRDLHSRSHTEKRGGKLSIVLLLPYLYTMRSGEECGVVRKLKGKHGGICDESKLTKSKHAAMISIPSRPVLLHRILILTRDLCFLHAFVKASSHPVHLSLASLGAMLLIQRHVMHITS